MGGADGFIPVRAEARTMTGADVKIYQSFDDALAASRSMVTRATDHVLIMGHRGVFELLETELRAARENDVLVLALVGVDPDVDPASIDVLDRTANVVRAWGASAPFPMNCVIDRRKGFVGGYGWSEESLNYGSAIAFEHDGLHEALIAMLQSTFWPRAHQVSTTTPNELPATYSTVYHAVIDATHYLGQDVAVRVRARVAPTTEQPSERIASEHQKSVEGPLITVRQSLVSPITSAFSGENTLVVRDGDDRVTIGGVGAYVEDYEGLAVELFADD